ncbi:bifunctional glycosyltransferase/CDP-glycerol:glycerophosphate glycerophosphotransferase [Streptomyces meridianus]|uniref:CDP-glycerol:glycerophosphate glycerophosphotransferase n=1 Tax=Streptomyces meridianus TaxID=2938945 RepID=A0ABT0WZL4_9ACTN|nr:CDP-glycerol glycerophosphotransferase family protein [Streptomyces meridianus]MCM2575766.1 CDP-glycerol:glycerophosphate glycerophosphotransferase [Streptomyces meridianus]
MNTMRGPAAGPDVSVVVIAYNDAARLPTAVRSVLEQTLHGVEAVVVDDCSTDGTYETARALAAEHPGRVRVFRLPENSGGCGAPRNRGIAEARGSFVMFLDSDDELERNACRNLLEAAERTEADLVSGLCVRVHVANRHGKKVEWYPWLYRHSQVLESIGELPDLLVFDTLSTNKCYRRDFLLERDLRFPVGIHYEDLLFSARAYLAARRIALIPNRVYFWNVVENGDAAARSISNRRHEIANFAHRMEIHRRIDELLEQQRLSDLKFHKDVKFLKHDLVLHLRDLPLLDAEYRRRFAELAAGYLDGVDPSAYAAAEPVHAICAYLLRKQDWDNLLPAADTLANRAKLSSPLVERNGRVYWCAEHLDDPEGRAVLDVTDAGYHTGPLERLFLRNRLTSYGDDGRGTLRLAGNVVNPLGRIARSARLRGRLEFRPRRKGLRTVHCFPLTALRWGDRYLEWEAAAGLTHGLRPLGVIDAVWDVRLVLDVDGTRLRTRISVDGVDLDGARSLPVRPRLTRLVADHLLPEVSRRGHLAFRLVAEGAVASRATRSIGGLVTGRPGSLAKRGLRGARQVRRRMNSGPTKIGVYHRLFCRLPVRPGLIVFESHLGKQYSDSPRAVYEELRHLGVPFEGVWSYAGRSADGFPRDAVLVRRWGWRYLLALARADFWIDNQGFPLKLAKRSRTTYIQTWHGSALKRMGFDEPRLRMMTRPAQEAHQRVLDRFDHFLVRSEHDVRTLAAAFRLRSGVPVRTGYPRNDPLVAERRREELTGARSRGPLAAELGIEDDRMVLLYAPTFRADASGKVRNFEPGFDLEAFARRFGDRITLLVRAHYLNRVVLPPGLRGKVVDVTSQHDVTPLLALADGLITDYSSLMFDYALLDRPMIFFAHDYDAYAGESRGTYFDLRLKAPGPVAETEEELFAAVADLKSAGPVYAEARQRFVAEFGEYDRGDAARRVVELIALKRGTAPGGPA